MLFDKDGLIFGQGGETSVSVTPSKITVRSEPTADIDVANKAYVDRVAGGTSVADSHIVNLIYPVGSIYMSVNSTSPATLFGGTCTQLQNRFLLGAGSSYTAGATGGEATHTLTVSEMPARRLDIRRPGARPRIGLLPAMLPTRAEVQRTTTCRRILWCICGNGRREK